MTSRFIDAAKRASQRFLETQAGPIESGVVGLGVVEAGEVVYHGVLGGDGEAARHHPDVFRVASLTKSFTAAAALRLRDQGLVDLDQSIDRFWSPARTWKAPPSIRQCLTMSAGLPTDNPWGDRHQDLPLSQFEAVVGPGGPGVRTAPWTYEYSNLGYAIVGTILSDVAGREYSELIQAMFLGPLGMDSSGFDPAAWPERLVEGLSRGSEGGVEPVVGHGAFSPMGGLLSTPADMARWVSFIAGGFNGPDQFESVLAARSRREMQTVHRPGRVRLDSGSREVVAGYGIGLRVVVEAGLGTTAGHTGGYPGFGAHMWWHPRTATGLVMLANRTYAPVWNLTVPLVAAEVTDLERLSPLADLEAQRSQVDALLDSWDDQQAAQLMSTNMERDQPLEGLSRQFSEAAGQGPYAPATGIEWTTPASVSWRRRGPDAQVAFEVWFSPESSPRVQQVDMRVIVDPAPSVAAVVEAAVAAMDGEIPDWPGTGGSAIAVRKGLAKGSLHYGPVSPVGFDRVDEDSVVLRAVDRRGDPVTITFEFSRGDLVSVEAVGYRVAPDEPFTDL